MYLTYDEYTEYGGTLDSSAFALYGRRAEQLVRSQAAGQTGIRIDALADVPQAVKSCIFDIIQFLSVNAPDVKTVISESQSSDGVTESYSYASKTDEQIVSESEDIIYNSFFGGGIGELLYRGIGNAL